MDVEIQKSPSRTAKEEGKASTLEKTWNLLEKDKRLSLKKNFKRHPVRRDEERRVTNFSVSCSPSGNSYT